VNPHLEAVRAAFTRQADYINTSPAFVNEERVRWLLRLARASSAQGIPLRLAVALDVACGAGIIAVALAAQVRHVTGVDITPAVLERAETRAREAQVHNVRFEVGDAARLPYPDACFDLVTCTSAFHHLDQSQRVMAEVARVLRSGGAFCAMDITTPEVRPAREQHQIMERLRDPSHTTNLTPSAWRRLAQGAGLKVMTLGVVPSHRDLEEWLTICSEEAKPQVRALFQQDMAEGLSGLQVRRSGDAVLFTHPMLLLRAEKE
jgi:SAM-dependent methyltransferase